MKPPKSITIRLLWDSYGICLRCPPFQLEAHRSLGPRISRFRRLGYSWRGGSGGVWIRPGRWIFGISLWTRISRGTA